MHWSQTQKKPGCAPGGLVFDVGKGERGWSIVIYGRTSAVSEPDELDDLWASDSLVPWTAANRTLFIRIAPERVSGRVVRRPT